MAIKSIVFNVRCPTLSNLFVRLLFSDLDMLALLLSSEQSLFELRGGSLRAVLKATTHKAGRSDSTLHCMGLTHLDNLSLSLTHFYQFYGTGAWLLTYSCWLE